MPNPPLESLNPGQRRVVEKKIAQRLEDAPRHLGALDHALKRFGDPFDQQLYNSVFSSDKPVNVNAIGAIERGIEKMANYINELAFLGLEMAGLKDGAEQLNAKRDLEKLRKIRVITTSLEGDLQDLRSLRKDLAHDYPGVRSGAVRDSALIAVARYPDFEKAFVAWKEAGFPENF